DSADPGELLGFHGKSLWFHQLRDRHRIQEDGKLRPVFRTRIEKILCRPHGCRTGHIFHYERWRTWNEPTIVARDKTCVRVIGATRRSGDNDGYRLSGIEIPRLILRHTCGRAEKPHCDDSGDL